jgi:hypothetical protein
MFWPLEESLGTAVLMKRGSTLLSLSSLSFKHKCTCYIWMCVCFEWTWMNEWVCLWMNICMNAFSYTMLRVVWLDLTKINEWKKTHATWCTYKNLLVWWFFPDQVWNSAGNLNFIWFASNVRQLKHRAHSTSSKMFWKCSHFCSEGVRILISFPFTSRGTF